MYTPTTSNDPFESTKRTWDEDWPPLPTSITTHFLSDMTPAFGLSYQPLKSIPDQNGLQSNTSLVSKDSSAVSSPPCGASSNQIQAGLVDVHIESFKSSLGSPAPRRTRNWPVFYELINPYRAYPSGGSSRHSDVPSIFLLSLSEVMERRRQRQQREEEERRRRQREESIRLGTKSKELKALWEFLMIVWGLLDQIIELMQTIRLYIALILNEVYSRFSEFPGGIRPPCTTMPWTIWPALVVLWGVCWMFYTPLSPVDEHQLHLLLQDEDWRLFPGSGK